MKARHGDLIIRVVLAELFEAAAERDSATTAAAVLCAESKFRALSFVEGVFHQGYGSRRAERIAREVRARLAGGE